jgi:RNA polymerase sigma-70 factor, ECF subfamily
MMQSEMTDCALQNARQDQAAVTAVRSGDAERYRELVERHQRRVFAVAWSRLGDVALAEEASQEAFIRAYRRLWLLGDGAKFAGWVNTIARRVAINFGLRHRRELNKRQRWALENPPRPAAQDAADETDPPCTPETLRQTLAELPDAHRECLVLFYIEGKSGAEAAAALGISEGALRVRLHRARAAMRERLEEKLEGSLAKLGPAQSLVPNVMGAVLNSSSAKFIGGSLGAKILSVLLPFKFLATFFFLIPMLPGLLFSLVTTRMEQRNYRDAEGFRARLHRRASKRLWITLPLVAVGMFLIVLLIYFVSSTSQLGIRKVFFVLGVFSLVVTVFLIRRLTISFNRLYVATFVSLLVLAVGCLAVGLSFLPGSAFGLFIFSNLLVSAIGFGSRRGAVDSNLFLRATQKMLEAVPAETNSSEAAPRLDKSQLRAFARFLADRWLVVDHHWQSQGLSLQLPPLTSSFGYFGKQHSSLMLRWNGSVSAFLGGKDEKFLLALLERALPERLDLEQQVAASVQLAWRFFRVGDAAAAARAVGQVPDADVYIVPPPRSKAVRWQRGVVLVLGSLGLALWALASIHPAWMDGMKPVSVTEAQVRAFLGNVHTNPNPIRLGLQRRFPGDPIIALSSCLVLPPTNLFSPDGLRATRQEVFRATGLNTNNEKQTKLIAFRMAWLLDAAMVGGWVDWNDVGLKPQDATAFFQHGKTNSWQFMLSPEKAGSWVDNTGWEVERMNNFTLSQLRWMRDVNCLNLLDSAKLIRQIASVQTVSGTPPGQPPIHDWRDVRGLFFTPNWPALEDTYFSLAALEILGGLDKIDREACIQGILSRHQGKGYFTSPTSGGYNEYHIDGSARDTFAAFESLRILGALDRVKDLDRWQFRLASHRSSEADANGARTPTWDEVEAWVCQQRLEKILRQKKENPQTPIGSLLQPGEM